MGFCLEFRFQRLMFITDQNVFSPTFVFLPFAEVRKPLTQPRTFVLFLVWALCLREFLKTSPLANPTNSNSLWVMNKLSLHVNTEKNVQL